jgi:single-stranded-DNA-specific exonuclease
MTALSNARSKLFAKLLEARGVDESFLSPKYEDLNAPDDLPDMAVAARRIRAAIKNRERILVFGDYDADGVTATAVLVRGLARMGADVTYDLPERTTDGYGLPRRVLSTLDPKVRVLVTVDCGSRDLEVARGLKEKGVDVIVTDHHEIGDLPDAVAVVNPKRADSEYPFRDLAGVGVAFQLVRALAPQGDWAKWLLDLVALGTVCDQVPLTGDNRIFVQYGLRVMERSKWRGLRELIRDVKKLDAHGLAFLVGPKINASGRLDTPRRALELLLTDDAMQAAELAMQLNDLNETRKQEQNRALESALTAIDDKNDYPVAVVCGKWHEGVIGLIASKLVERCEKPAFVWTASENDETKIKCSARSFGEFSCAKAIQHLQSLGLIEKGGGHAAAGGMTALAENLEAIETALQKYYRGLGLQDQLQFLHEKPDMRVEDVSELTLDFWRELQLLEPYGQGNGEPIFRVRGHLLEKRTMGKANEHAAFKISDKERKSFELCAWRGAQKFGDLSGLAEYDFDFMAVCSDFREEHVEGRVVNITRSAEV